MKSSERLHFALKRGMRQLKRQRLLDDLQLLLSRWRRRGGWRMEVGMIHWCFWGMLDLCARSARQLYTPGKD